MLSTTEAIVLSLRKHKDKSLLLHAYTRAYGRVNYMVYGLGRKHPMGLYAPLSLLQITADHSASPASRPPVVKEATRWTGDGYPADEGRADMRREAMALFVAEVLYHTLRHPMADEPMFDFIADAVRELYGRESDAMDANFHLRFLVGFAARLGFAIDTETDHASLLEMPLTRSGRQAQLRRLCDYFAEHVETWQTPRSLDILTEVFD